MTVTATLLSASREQLKTLALGCGLSDNEWEHLCKVLGRLPSATEIQMIGVMWSEHCSYKNSKPHLRKLISKGKGVLQGPGENAGLIQIDEKRAVAFKVESHNHPSFVEPFQGAATGVGGILRDIFTMGARPIATGNYLRFGDLRTPKHSYLLDGVVSGIAHYGNCIGVPNVAGHISANTCYQGNILVNVFALGIVDLDKIFRSNSAKPGQSVMIWGAKTGRDGIHGASLLASADFDSDKKKTDESENEQKIRVQVGDPFKEKCLMDACLEVMTDLKDDLTAIQDFGAAGLTCSTMEISDKSQIGMRLELSKVPVREEKMEAFELLLSESQERMMAIVKKGSEEKFKKVLHKWGCEAEVIGETTDTKRAQIFYHDELMVDLPVSDLTDPPAVELAEPSWPELSLTSAVPADVKNEWEILLKLLSYPSVASKKRIYERYDSTVGARTVFGPGAEAAVLWIGENAESFEGIAFKGVADEDFYELHPKLGAQISMARAARGLACVGAKPIGITDGINVGNPHLPHVQGALKFMVEGMNEAIEIFETPCVSGNVSMYNQTIFENQPMDIFPTTFIVMVGLMKDVRKSTPSSFQKAGSEVWALEVSGNSENLPVNSLYSRLFWKEEERDGRWPFLDLKSEKRLQNALLAGNDRNLFLSARDISQGGLAVSLAKACVGGEKNFGFEGDLSKTQSRRDQVLFGEHQGRPLVEIDPAKRSELMKLGLEFQIQLKRIGSVTSDETFRIGPLLSGDTIQLLQAWSGTFK
ncbi:MAG: phosphoribosylformylglycinamidine synthase subunit PurL [Deltaproteobacteria bacterium]|nr:phosphoribosylformylglycinamidine synthase subunit PurL [Deltaproteobacteria bacterium]